MGRLKPHFLRSQNHLCSLLVAVARLSPHAAAMLVTFSAAPGIVAAPGAQLAAVARRCRAW